MDISPRCPFIEERSRPFGDVLNVDDGYALGIRLLNGSLNVPENGFGIPKRKLTARKIVVLQDQSPIKLSS